MATDGNRRHHRAVAWIDSLDVVVTAVCDPHGPKSAGNGGWCASDRRWPKYRSGRIDVRHVVVEGVRYPDVIGTCLYGVGIVARCNRVDDAPCPGIDAQDTASK